MDGWSAGKCGCMPRLENKLLGSGQLMASGSDDRGGDFQHMVEICPVKWVLGHWEMNARVCTPSTFLPKFSSKN